MCSGKQAQGDDLDVVLQSCFRDLFRCQSDPGLNNFKACVT